MRFAAVGVVMVVMVRIRILVKSLFAVEHQEIHTERIESSYKDTRQNSEISESSTKQMAFMNSFYDAVF